MSVTIAKDGRRHYLMGDTFAIKDRIKAAGGHWDGDRRAWWVGKAETALELSGHPSAAPSASGERQEAPTQGLSEDDKVEGRATYKGKTYVLVWEGMTKRGHAAKLAFSDGSKTFWANAGEYQVTKRYLPRERYGVSKPMTFGRLKALRENYAQDELDGNEDGIRNGQRYECEECGEWVTRGQGTCWETGAAH